MGRALQRLTLEQSRANDPTQRALLDASLASLRTMDQTRPFVLLADVQRFLLTAGSLAKPS
jgi:hypothetical protein